MKNNFSETINEVVDKAREIAHKVDEAIETTIENAGDVVEAVTETIDTAKETASTVAGTINNAPKLDEVMQAMINDSRVGHFLVDILSGMNVNEASAKHFPREKQPEVSTTDIDTLVNEAEQRGYLRGRNEQIEVKMHEASRWHQTPTNRKPTIETTILNHPRRSVWEE